MRRANIDSGAEFDFGKTAIDYARWRDIYPDELYDQLIALGVGHADQTILDLGSGPAILPLNLHHTGARFIASDIAAEQLRCGEELARERGITDVRFLLCGAEDIPLADNNIDAVTAVQCFHYFSQPRAADEIRRVLRPGGVLCRVMMEWLPFEDPIIREMEAAVLRYNPRWSGGGFRAFSGAVPDWAKGRFVREQRQELDATLTFSREGWLRRVMTCRGVGASLSSERADAFEQEYRAILADYPEPLRLLHRIEIDLYRSTKEG